MSQRGDACDEDVESGQPLLGGGGNDYVNLGQALEEDDSGGNSMSLDVEDPSARSSPVAQADDTYRDRGWAYAFRANIIITIITAGCFGRLAAEAILAQREHGGWRPLRLSDSPHEFGWLSAFVVGLGLVAIVVGLAMFVVYSLVSCGKPVVQSSIALTHLLWLLMVLMLAGLGKNTWALLALVAFPIVAYIFYRGRDRFPFGVATLKVASVAIKSMPGLIFTSLYMVFAQLVYILVSLAAALGSYAYLETVEGSDGSMHRAIDCGFYRVEESHVTPGCYCKGEMVSEGACMYRGWGIPLILLWFVPILWGCLVASYVVRCTVSGSVAAWWYSPNDVKPVLGAYYRATRYSYGTLCKAAASTYFGLIVLSIVRMMLWVPGANCLLRASMFGITYWQDYTVTFVGIYGLDSASAFRRVRELFARRAATSLANDLIAFLASFFLAVSTSIVFGVLLGATLVGISEGIKLSFQVMAPIAFGYVAFAFTITMVLELVRSAVKAVFVCFIQDPGVLKSTRGDELHDELTAAWLKIHPKDEPSDDTARSTELPNTAHSHTQ